MCQHDLSELVAIDLTATEYVATTNLVGNVVVLGSVYLCVDRVAVYTPQ
jgi:hypothetical protein